MQLCDVSDADVKFLGNPGNFQSSMVAKLKFEASCRIDRKLTLANIQNVSTLTVYNAIIPPFSTVPRLAYALVRFNFICTISCFIDTIVNSAGTFIDIL